MEVGQTNLETDKLNLPPPYNTKSNPRVDDNQGKDRIF